MEEPIASKNDKIAPIFNVEMRMRRPHAQSNTEELALYAVVAFALEETAWGGQQT
jgi:hypothetical protein